MPVTGSDTKKTKTITILRPCFLKNPDGSSDIRKVGDVITGLPLHEANLLIGNGQAVEGEHKIDKNDEQYKRWEQKEADKKKKPAQAAA